MCCKNLWKSFVPFALAFSLSLFINSCIVADYSSNDFKLNAEKPLTSNESIKKQILNEEMISLYYEISCCGIGASNHKGLYDKTFNDKPSENTSSKIKPLRVLSKPKAEYTESARANNLEGIVRLRVSFLSTGKIGTITPVMGLPDGLTFQAYEAAKKIKFVPAEKDGKPVTTTRIVEYTFTLY